MNNKRILSFVLCVIMVASLFTGMVSTASADDTLTHAVKNGDYLFKICKNYGLDYYACKNAIMILNGFVTEAQLNKLTVGQVLTLPVSNAVAATVKGSTSTTTTTTQTVTVNGVTTTTSSTSTLSGIGANYAVSYYLIPHVMQYGETLASVCNDLGTSYGAYSSVILAANGITNANKIWAGKTVYIPSTKAPSAGGCYAVVAHTVSSGETMTSICSQYGQSYAANATLINGLNRTTNLNKIYVGQTIYIPVVAAASSGVGTGTGTGTGTSNVAQSGYNITFEVAANGKPYATVNDYEVNRADFGKTVKIIANGNNGFAQSSLKVVRTDNKASVTVASNNTFVMPPCDVVITVEYKKAPAISRTPAYHGTYTTQVNGVNVDFACPNDKVVLAFNPDYSYTCVSAKYTVGDSSTPIEIKQSTDGTWSFIMPEERVTVEVVFDRGNLKALTTDGFDPTKEGSVIFKVDGTQCKSAAQNAQVVATITPKTDYKIKQVDIFETGTTTLVTFTKNGNDYSFKMPNAPVTVKVTFEYSKKFALKYVGDNNKGTVYFTTPTLPGEVITSAAGTDHVYAVPSPRTGYKYKTGSLSITYSDKQTMVPYSGTYNEFVMPHTDLFITAEWEADSLPGYSNKVSKCLTGTSRILVTPAGKPGQQEKSTAFAGDNVVVEVSPYTGHICYFAEACYAGTSTPVPGATVHTGAGGNVTDIEYTMPADNVSIRFEFKKVENYVDIKWLDKTEGKLQALIGGHGAVNGIVNSTFEIRPIVNAGWELQKVNVFSKTTGKTTEVTPKDGRYFYTIKAEEYNEVTPADNYLELQGVWKAIEKPKLNIPQYVTATGATALDASKGVYEADGKAAITLSPAPGLTFDTATVDVYTGSESAGTKKAVENVTATGASITFEMPNEDATVLVKFEPLTISVSANPGTTTASLSSASSLLLHLNDEFTVEWDWGNAAAVAITYGSSTETITDTSVTTKTFKFTDYTALSVTLVFT